MESMRNNMLHTKKKSHTVEPSGPVTTAAIVGDTVVLGSSKEMRQGNPAAHVVRPLPPIVGVVTASHTERENQVVHHASSIPNTPS
jgi:hypothetical protein